MLENSKILDVPTRIDHSLIGKDVVIRRNAGPPNVLRFMAGDHSEVGLV